jgi:hypothetical protein
VEADLRPLPETEAECGIDLGLSLAALARRSVLAKSDYSLQ